MPHLNCNYSDYDWLVLSCNHEMESNHYEISIEYIDGTAFMIYIKNMIKTIDQEATFKIWIQWFGHNYLRSVVSTKCF